MFKGELEVAGQTVSLRSITCPVFLLGGDEDYITPWQQVHNMRYAVGSVLVRRYLAPGGHIDLFIGHRSQAEYWTPILAHVRKLSAGCSAQAAMFHPNDAGQADDFLHLCGGVGPQRPGSDVTGRRQQEKGRSRLLVAGELGENDDVVLADGPHQLGAPAGLLTAPYPCNSRAIAVQSGPQ